MPETVSFTAMADGTREDYEMLAAREEIYVAGTASSSSKFIILIPSYKLTFGYRRLFIFKLYIQT